MNCFSMLPLFFIIDSKRSEKDRKVDSAFLYKCFADFILNEKQNGGS